MSTQFYFNRGNCWAFALSWQPLLQPLSRLQRHRFLTQSRAYAWVEKKQQWRSLGFSSCEIVANPCFSAAAAFALLYPTGMRFALYIIEDGCYWLVGVHEGLPLKAGDQLFDSLEAAQEQYALLTQRHPSLPSLEIADVDVFYEQATNVIAKDIRLQAFRAWNSTMMASIFIFGGVLLWLYSWATTQSVAAVQLEAPIQMPTAIHTELAKKRHGSHSLWQLLDSSLALPVSRKGWHLIKNQCTAAQSSWSCLAEYRAVKESALLSDFQSGLPRQWKVTVQDLQGLRLEYVVANDTLEQQEPDYSKATDLLNHVQKDKLLFQQARLSEPNSQTHAMRQRQLLLKGAWPALQALKSWPDLVEWKQVTLKAPHSLGSQTQADALQWILTGVIHEYN